MWKYPLVALLTVTTFLDAMQAAQSNTVIDKVFIETRLQEYAEKRAHSSSQDETTQLVTSTNNLLRKARVPFFFEDSTVNVPWRSKLTRAERKNAFKLLLMHYAQAHRTCARMRQTDPIGVKQQEAVILQQSAVETGLCSFDTGLLSVVDFDAYIERYFYI